MKKAILIQARLSSSRFPKKMLEKLETISLVEFVYKRCEESNIADEVIVVTSSETSDDELYRLCTQKNMKVFRGDLNNVLKRYIDTSNHYEIDVVCRVCGDSPFVDISAIDKMFHDIEMNPSLDYLSTTNSLNGFMSEVFSSNLLKKVYNNVLSKEDKEHVTKYIRDNIEAYNTSVLDLDLRPQELEDITLTIDYVDDLKIAKNIAFELKDFTFSSEDIIKILKYKKSINEL